MITKQLINNLILKELNYSRKQLNEVLTIKQIDKSLLNNGFVKEPNLGVDDYHSFIKGNIKIMSSESNNLFAIINLETKKMLKIGLDKANSTVLTNILKLGDKLFDDKRFNKHLIKLINTKSKEIVKKIDNLNQTNDSVVSKSSKLKAETLEDVLINEINKRFPEIKKKLKFFNDIDSSVNMVQIYSRLERFEFIINIYYQNKDNNYIDQTKIRNVYKGSTDNYSVNDYEIIPLSILQNHILNLKFSDSVIEPISKNSGVTPEYIETINNKPYKVLYSDKDGLYIITDDDVKIRPLDFYDFSDNKYKKYKNWDGTNKQPQFYETKITL